MTNRRVMQMALDALLTCKADAEEEGFGFIQDHVIYALREALSRSEAAPEVAQPEPEPVAWRWRVYHQNGGYTEHLCTDVVEAQGYDESYLVRGSIDPLYLAPPAPEVPAGWELVPIEPTEEMIEQGAIGMASFDTDVVWPDSFDKVQVKGMRMDAKKSWRYMLAAAPEYRKEPE